MIETFSKKYVNEDKIEINILGSDLDISGKLTVNSQVFNCNYGIDDPVKRFRPVHEVVRWQMCKSRVSTQSIKNRSQVSGAHRKVWGQKESGRARQGDGKACHFRGGGACFSVSHRDYSFKLNKKYKNLAMCIALSHKVKNNGLVVLEDINQHNLSKTKSARNLLSKLTQDPKILLVTQDRIHGIDNLPYTDVIKPEGLNVKDICDRFLIFDKKSINAVQDRLVK
jgi:large subunit ribosomal protein L4